MCKQSCRIVLNWEKKLRISQNNMDCEWGIAKDLHEERHLHRIAQFVGGPHGISWFPPLAAQGFAWPWRARQLRYWYSARLVYSWGFPKMGVPHSWSSWMVYNGKSHRSKRMMTGGTPILGNHQFVMQLSQIVTVSKMEEILRFFSFIPVEQVGH